jgi:hypothetical protein
MQGRFGRFVLQGRAVVRHPEWIAKLVTVRVEGVPVPDAKAFQDHLSYCLVQLDNILCKLGSYFTDSNVMLGSMSKYYISYSHRNYKAFFTSTSVFEMIERDFFSNPRKFPIACLLCSDGIISAYPTNTLHTSVFLPRLRTISTMLVYLEGFGSI